MSLTPGTRFGPYAIVSAIGAGGMGEVYKAHDTRLDRDVAIKVLPAAFATDPDRRARFEREAKAIAALSHPNILAIFDTGVQDGHAYVVTELLEGETLREKLTSAPRLKTSPREASSSSSSAATGSARGSREDSESSNAGARARGSGAPRASIEVGGLPIRKAIEIAMQIARGLAAAHDKGLVHRDLKPENVFVLKDGQVKILDFGLARSTVTSSATTETAAAMTDAGTVMGTVGYMAPEQVRGQVVDARADLFSFGAVLYEMLSGRRAFAGESAADTLTAILKEDPPDLSATQTNISPALDRIIRHCLEKNLHERFQTARDVAFALEALSGTATVTSTAIPSIPALPARRGWIRPLLWAASVVAAAAAGMVAQHAMAPPSSHVQYETKTFDRQTIFNARFMPDGKTIVYSAARQDTTPELFILHPDSVAPQSMGGAGMHLLAVSSKGELAVLTGASYIASRLFTGTLARMSPGGSPRQWLEGVREADWSPDGVSLAVIRDLGTGRDVLEYPAGTPLYEASGYLSDPRVSHDGKHVAFMEHPFRWDDRGWVKVIDTAKQVVTLTGELWGAEGLAWSGDDEQIVFSGSEATRPGGVNYQPYVVPSSGHAPARVVLSAMAETTVFDVSLDGRWLVLRDELRQGIVVKKPGDSAERDLSWLDQSNNAQLSDDGSIVVFTNQNSSAGTNYAVMLRNTDGSPAVTLGEGNVRRGGLSPDGKWVAAYVPTTSQFVFYPTGPGEARRSDVRMDRFRFSGWFADSQHVLFCGGDTSKPRGCYKYATAGGALTLVGPEGATDGAVGPDGWTAILDKDNKGWLYPPDGGPPVPARAPEGDVVAFIAKASGFVVRWGPNRGLQIDRQDFLTGARTPVATIVAPDRTGLLTMGVSSVVGEPGRYGYAYFYVRRLSTLVVASGITLR